METVEREPESGFGFAFEAEEEAPPAPRRRRRGWALGCVAAALLPVLVAAGVVGVSAYRSRSEKDRAAEEAEAAALAFVRAASGLDYAQGLPHAGLAELAAAGDVRLVDVAPGEGWTAVVRLRAERGYTSSPVPLRRTMKRCYRVVLGVPGPIAAPQQVTC